MHVTLSPLIFSLSSLQSLSLRGFAKEPVLLCPITLTHLKSLSMTTTGLRNHFFSRLTSHLNVLEHLHLHYLCSVDRFRLKSAKIKRLELVIMGCRSLRISAPSLEFFQLEGGLIKDFLWEMPLLKKAIIRLKLVAASNVPATCQMLKALAHLEDLHLDIEESKDVEYPFHALLVSGGVDLPTYFTLKHFNLEVCFHEYNIEDLVALLQHFPALESLQLVHKPPLCSRKNKKKLWRSKLPRNAEGNYRHGNFKDLHVDEKRKEVIEQLTRKQFSKKLKA